MKEPDQTPTLAERLFPIMGAPSIPWAVIAPCEAQAQCNHGQTLERLAEHQGLSPCEAVAVLEGRDWRPMGETDSRARLEEIVKERYYLPEIDRLTAALSAMEAEKETYRARWLSCVTPEEAERLRAALSVAERERDEAYRQNPILREQVRELQERLAVLDEAYRAVTEQLSRSATLQATAEVERDSLREQLEQADAVVYFHNAYPDGIGQWCGDAVARHQERDASRKRTEEGGPLQDSRTPVSRP